MVSVSAFPVPSSEFLSGRWSVAADTATDLCRGLRHLMTKYMTTPSSMAIATTATKKAADNHGIIPRFGRLSFSSKVPCCTTGPTDSADDGRVTPAFGSVGLFAGTVGVDEPVASLDNAGAVPV
jgi:hypothetical protein